MPRTNYLIGTKMNWMLLGIAAAVTNSVLLVSLVTVTLWPGYTELASWKGVVIETLKEQVNKSSPSDEWLWYQGDMEMSNPTRPVLHLGFMMTLPSSRSSIVKMDIGAPPEAMTTLLQGFQLHDGGVYVPLTGYYVIYMDVTYFFRGHVDGTQVKVYVACTATTKVFVEITQWCRIGRYCSVTFHGISFLSQGAVVYCEANHPNEIITAVENTHICLAFF